MYLAPARSWSLCHQPQALRPAPVSYCRRAFSCTILHLLSLRQAVPLLACAPEAAAVQLSGCSAVLSRVRSCEIENAALSYVCYVLLVWKVL